MYSMCGNHMPKLIISISEEKNQILEEVSGENMKYESKSDAIEDFIQKEKNIEELKNQIEKLENEKKEIFEDKKEKIDFVEYVEEDFKYRNASVVKRVKWWIFGKNN